MKAASDSRRHLAVAAALGAACALGAPRAHGLDALLEVPPPAVAEASAAFRYANMTDEGAFAELDRRSLPYARVEAGRAPGVRAPVRLTGRLHGVSVHSSIPAAQRATSAFEILDARLALALDDFAAILERHDVDEVVHFSLYRPGFSAPRAAVAPVVRLQSATPSPPRGPSPAASLPGVRGQDPHGHVDEPTFEIVHPSIDPDRARVRDSVAPRRRSTVEPPRAPAKKPGPGAASASKITESHERKQKSAADDAKPPQTVGAARGGGARVVTPPPRAAQAPAWRPRGPVAAALPLPPPAPAASPPAPGTRHPAGLAIDVGVLHKKDGRWISVGVSFHGHIGDKTCGADIALPEDPNAAELRAIVCEARDLGVFTYVLTPNYNAAHVDHFHMEIKPGVRWFLYH